MKSLETRKAKLKLHLCWHEESCTILNPVNEKVLPRTSKIKPDERRHQRQLCAELFSEADGAPRGADQDSFVCAVKTERGLVSGTAWIRTGTTESCGGERGDILRRTLSEEASAWSTCWEGSWAASLYFPREAKAERTRRDDTVLASPPHPSTWDELPQWLRRLIIRTRGSTGSIPRNYKRWEMRPLVSHRYLSIPTFPLETPLKGQERSQGEERGPKRRQP